MGKRCSFRPTLDGALEERVVMSHGGAVAEVAGRHVAPASASANIHNTPEPLGPVGVLGDSYSDEYRFYPPDRSVARNWVEILHATREVSFGKYSLQSRGEPRNQGFAYDWARSDATSVDMIRDQLPGLTQQVAQGQIRYAAIFIGGNDFLHLLLAAKAGLISPEKALPALVQTEARAEANFATAARTLLAASPDVKLVVFNLPNLALLPAAQQAATTPEAKLFLEFTGLAIQRYNASIAAVAASSPRIALVDLAGVTAQAASSPTGTISFGGQTIDLLTPGDDYHHFFLADMIHVGTIGQGIIAELFAQAVENSFGSQLFPPSMQEVVHLAKVTQLHAQRPGGHRP